ncbi:DUF2087 domain-containing protein [Clostridiaceae bacterium M8S5]|nr:DUF2087 domain-containing protein [Clostridiaceae bacterium M8S5]
MENETMFWDASIHDLKKGYIYDESTALYTCIFCGYKLECGVIHKYNDTLMTSEKRMKLHIQENHGGSFNYLINLNKKLTGLTQNQQEVITCFYKNKTDKEIAKELGITESTIRNYRFKLREKEKQSKILLSIMQLLNEKSSKKEEYINIHQTATMVDDRYCITEDENQKILKRYFTDEGYLKTLPSKEKRKIIVLRKVAKLFKPDVHYTEKEVNRVLERIHEDHVILRRYLIEYGFLDRKNDCSIYWLK